MTILGLDLDGVCADYNEGLRQFNAALLGKDPATMANPTTWSYADTPGWDIDSTETYLQRHGQAVSDGLFAKLAPYEGLSESLWEISDAGVYIKVVTHRLGRPGNHAQATTDTVNWLDAPTGPTREGKASQRVPYRDLCFVANKALVGADIYIDDAPHNIEALRTTGATVLIFDQLYNRHLEGPRVRNWDEARDAILDFHARNSQAASAA